jgi:hypothetical protein
MLSYTSRKYTYILAGKTAILSHTGRTGKVGNKIFSLGCYLSPFYVEVFFVDPMVSKLVEAHALAIIYIFNLPYIKCALIKSGLLYYMYIYIFNLP